MHMYICFILIEKNLRGKSVTHGVNSGCTYIVVEFFLCFAHLYFHVFLQIYLWPFVMRKILIKSHFTFDPLNTDRFWKVPKMRMKYILPFAKT